MESKKIKEFYKDYADHIVTKRWKSKYLLRAYAHEQQYASILSYVQKGMKVLDAGCGEGVLALMIAEKGAIVVGIDMSEPNIEMCNKRTQAQGLEDMATFLLGDAEDLPFQDNTFDLVVSSHVLEHLPDFDKGLKEALRVSKKRAVVAIPTICNPCSLVQVGGGWFYLKGLRSFLALPYGFLLMIIAFVSGKEGVNESYGGYDVPHIFRFIKVMKKKITNLNLALVEYEASSVCLPYFSALIPIIKFLDKNKKKTLLRNCGYGTTFVIEK